jgi:hypothetical protein
MLHPDSIRRARMRRFSPGETGGATNKYPLVVDDPEAMFA